MHEQSPTKAELIMLTDNVGLVELFKEFVEFLTMRDIETPIVYENCNAVVSLVTLGGGVTRTKHLRARMHLGKEMVDEKRLKVVYKKGDDMLADGFSKPYDPVKHKPFAIELMGTQKSVNRWALEDMMKSDLKDTKKSDEGDQNKRKEMEKGVRSCPILEKRLKEKRQQKAS
jgi:hypothetical protein